MRSIEPGISRFRIHRCAIVLKGSLVIWGAAMGLRAALEMIYFDYPRQPDPAMGRTVPYMVKNTIIYMTENQNDVLYWLVVFLSIWYSTCDQSDFK